MPRSKSPAARGKASPRSRRSASPSSGRVARGKKGAALVALPFADYAPKATVRDDLRVLSSMWFGKIAGESHQDKLESFYKNQAELYDGYRQRMLHARPPMMSNLMVQPERKGKVVWVDLGGGTGANVEYMRDAITEGWFKKIVVLDLTPSLCAVAIKRAEERYSDVMEVICGDACDTTDKRLPPAGLTRRRRRCASDRSDTPLHDPPCRARLLTRRACPLAGTVDLVTFSYALVMIPDWRAAVANALRLLRPGGHLCVCDFTLLPEQGQARPPPPPLWPPAAAHPASRAHALAWWDGVAVGACAAVLAAGVCAGPRPSLCRAPVRARTAAGARPRAPGGGGEG